MLDRLAYWFAWAILAVTVSGHVYMKLTGAWP